MFDYSRVFVSVHEDHDDHEDHDQSGTSREGHQVQNHPDGLGHTNVAAELGQ
jgi:hypothetical protein